MARNRNKRKGINNYASVPRYVMDCDSFKSLRGNSALLLFLLAHQYKGRNNGDLTAAYSIYKDHFKSTQTLFSAREELDKKGFIVVNSYGGMSYGGYKLPTLYALTWLSVDDFHDLSKNQFRKTNLAIGKEPLKYFLQGINPKYKTPEQKKKQYKKDLKNPNVKHSVN